MYLSCDNNDLEQLQDQLIRLAALGVIFITRAHEEVFQLPANGLLFLISPDPMTCCSRWKPMAVMVVAMIVTILVMLPTAVCGAVESHGAGQAPTFWKKIKQGILSEAHANLFSRDLISVNTIKSTLSLSLIRTPTQIQLKNSYKLPFSFCLSKKIKRF